ncbi:MAG: carbohydrate kinase family protein [Candidatus Uhrbacteria bacterium]
MYDIITIGSATRDVFLRSKAIEVQPDSQWASGLEQCFPLGDKITIDELCLTTGGGATNAAVTFSRLGKLRTACAARVGHDDNSAAVLAELKNDRVNTRFIQHDARQQTAFSVIVLAGSGERTVLIHRGASSHLNGRAIPWKSLRSRWFYVTSLDGNLALLRRILAHAKKIGARVAWNPGGGEIIKGWKIIAPLAKHCAVFNVNREEAAALTGHRPNDLNEILAALRDANRIALVTDGPGGAYACTGKQTWHIASRDLKVINSTGAGDAFGSGFVLGLMLAGRNVGAGFIPARTGGHEVRPYADSIDYALRLAMANAESVITHMGAKTGILKRAPSPTTLAMFTVKTP